MPPVLVRYGAADRTVRARLYAESDFFLFTGDPETFLFLREAMASELPVIAPGSVPERLRDLICLSAGNTDELAGCLREAMVSRESLAGHGARSGRKAACLWSREAGLMWLSERITHYFDELV
jgi:glycosyltransferase involved in cell wall biosynthesis